MAQPKLPGTTPPPEEARRRHKVAVKTVRDLEDRIEISAAAVKDLKAELKKANKILRSAEDDLDAIEDGKRAER